MKGGEVVEEKLRETYSAPNLQVVLLRANDVLTTSGPLGTDGTPDYEEDSWARA